MSVPLPLQPQVRVGDYELVRLLGAGGMGDVWLATDTRALRPVALKFVKPQLLSDPSFRTRFLNEARTLGRLEHDRIVTLYNVVEEHGHLALVLRFIQGRSLADRIDADGALPIDAVLACARDILPALGFAHTQGTIHRDIKPQNVLIDGQGRAFLTDFGISVGDALARNTMTGFAIGTPHYMSPEQIQTPADISVERRGHRSDIYSFGVVLFEMLTGRVPFGADLGPTEVYRIQHAHCVEAPASLRELNPKVPEAVERVVLDTLAKNPDDRPQTCEELLARLEAATGAVSHQSAARAARAVTIVEGSRAPASPAAKAPAAAVPQPASTRRSSPVTIWLAVGAVAIVALVSAAIWAGTGSGPSSASSSEVTTPASQEGPAAGPGQAPPPENTGTARGTVGSQPPPPVPGPVPASVPDSQVPPPQVAAGVPAAPSRPPAAEALIAEAHRLGDQENWCLAKARMDEAARLGALSPAEQNFREQAQLGCQLETPRE